MIICKSPFANRRWKKGLIIYDLRGTRYHWVYNWPKFREGYRDHFMIGKINSAGTRWKEDIRQSGRYKIMIISHWFFKMLSTEVFCFLSFLFLIKLINNGVRNRTNLPTIGLINIAVPNDKIKSLVLVANAFSLLVKSLQ